LKRNLQEAKIKTETIISSEINATDIKNLNIDNLQQGKDSEGANMPSYSNPEYASDKTQINPRNRGFWDLRLTGEYYSGIKVLIQKNKISFTQLVNNEKTQWLEDKLNFWRKKPLGIEDEVLNEYLTKKRPKMQEKLKAIIRNGM